MQIDGYLTIARFFSYKITHTYEMYASSLFKYYSYVPNPTMVIAKLLAGKNLPIRTEDIGWGWERGGLDGLDIGIASGTIVAGDPVTLDVLTPPYAVESSVCKYIDLAFKIFI